MVKIGFIVEGDSEMVFMRRNSAFSELLVELGIELVAIVDGEGGELYNENILNGKKSICKDAGAEHIFILTDLDEDSSFTEKKAKLNLDTISATIIAKKAFEAWFLADTETLRKVINSTHFYCEAPEEIDLPFSYIKQLRVQFNNGVGIGSKPLLAGKMNLNGFDIRNAAQHPNCPSAKYFIQKLHQISHGS